MAIAWLTGFGDEIDASLDIQMDVLDTLGISAIELRGVDGKNIAQVTPEEAKGIHARMSGRGFVPSALGSPIGKSNITDPFAPVLDTFKQLLEVAGILGAPAIRLFSFFIPDGEYVAWRDEVMARMQALKDAARGTGVVLLHENESAIYGDYASRCVDLAQTLCDDQFGLIYDPSNFVQVGDDVWAAWNAVKPYVRYFHMKDSYRRLPGDESNPHCVVGNGDARVADVLADVAKTDFAGYFSIEPHLTHSDHVPGTNPEKWIAAANGLKGLLADSGIAVKKPQGRQ